MAVLNEHPQMHTTHPMPMAIQATSRRRLWHELQIDLTPEESNSPGLGVGEQLIICI
jgi:hypothetical protein